MNNNNTNTKISTIHYLLYCTDIMKLLQRYRRFEKNKQTRIEILNRHYHDDIYKYNRITIFCQKKNEQKAILTLNITDVVALSFGDWRQNSDTFLLWHIIVFMYVGEVTVINQYYLYTHTRTHIYIYIYFVHAEILGERSQFFVCYSLTIISIYASSSFGMYIYNSIVSKVYTTLNICLTDLHSLSL